MHCSFPFFVSPTFFPLLCSLAQRRQKGHDSFNRDFRTDSRQQKKGLNNAIANAMLDIALFFFVRSVQVWQFSICLKHAKERAGGERREALFLVLI